MSVRLPALLCAAAAVLLTSCGGGEEASPSAPHPPAVGTPTTRATLAVPPRGTDSPPRTEGHVLYRRSQWQVGDVVTRDDTAKVMERIVKLGEDGATEPMRETEQVTKARWLERCLEVDGDGNRTRYEAYIAEWMRKTGDLEDDSLKGASVEVKGAGKARTWRLVGESTVERSAGAREWLDEQFGANPADDDTVRRMMLPDRPVAVGDSWTPDVSAIADSLKKKGLEVNRGRMTATAKLESVDGDEARCSMQAALPLSRPPKSGEAGGSWVRGGTVMVELQVRIPREGRLLIESRLDRRMALEGDIRQIDATIRPDLRLDETRENTVGGEFPERKG